MKDKNTVSKKDLVVLVSEKLGFTKKDTGIVVNAIFDEIEEQVKNGNTVNICGFGTFGAKERKQRQSVDIVEIKKMKDDGKKSGFKDVKSVEVNPSYKAYFKVGYRLKNELDKAYDTKSAKKTAKKSTKKK